MSARLRSVARLVLVSQFSVALACSGSGPGGPGEPAGAHFAGVLTVGSQADPGSGQAFHAAAALAGARVELAAAGEAIASVTTGSSGAFSATVPAGAYTVQVFPGEGPPFAFGLSLPPGGALFAQGRVDQTPAGDFTLNVQVFRDGDGDATPDDAFRVQILDRVQGDDASGVEDVVVSQAEAAEAVTLCHAPPGNPDAAHTISVGAPAVPAHLAHGDTEGACAEDGGEEEGEDEEGEGEGDEEESEEDGQAKVLVCHVPPGNPENPVTIEVAEPAVPAHLAHGDTEGACEGDTGPDDEGEEEEGDEPELEPEDDGQPRVLVCHVPPGNPDNPVTIEIAAPAVPAHLAHGDTEGACAGETPPAEGEEGEESGGGEG